MTSAALLPAMDDGFSVAYWMRNYRTWADEVDELIVLTSGPSAETSPIEGPNVRVIRCAPGWVQHGEAIRRLLAATTADRILLCEEDAYARRPGVIREHLAMLDEWDVVASPRDGGSGELLARAHARWGECRSGDEQGTGFWPAFGFFRREALDATDLLFEPRRWRKGQVVPGLRMRAPAEVSDETMMCVSWQMRDQGRRIRLVDQYRTTDHWLMRRWLGTDPPWFHVGSLSSGAGLYNGEQRNLPEHVRAHAWDYARRISWWQRFADLADPDDPRLPSYRELLAELAEPCDPDFVGRWRLAYEPWITWLP